MATLSEKEKDLTKMINENLKRMDDPIAVLKNKINRVVASTYDLDHDPTQGRGPYLTSPNGPLPTTIKILRKPVANIDPERIGNNAWSAAPTPTQELMTGKAFGQFGWHSFTLPIVDEIGKALIDPTTKLGKAWQSGSNFANDKALVLSDNALSAAYMAHAPIRMSHDSLENLCYITV